MPGNLLLSLVWTLVSLIFSVLNDEWLYSLWLAWAACRALRSRSLHVRIFTAPATSPASFSGKFRFSQLLEVIMARCQKPTSRARVCSPVITHPSTPGKFLYAVPSPAAALLYPKPSTLSQLARFRPFCSRFGLCSGVFCS